MIVGIIDEDFKNPGNLIFNIDAMRTSAYHKSKGNIVKYISDYNNINNFGLIYYFKDKEDGLYPPYLSDSHINLFGSSFSGGISIPYKPEIVNFECDPYIYPYIDLDNINSNTSKSFYKKNFTYQHIKISEIFENKVDSKLIYRDDSRGIFIHDYNISKCPSFYNIVQNINKKNPLYLKYYQYFKTVEEALLYTNLNIRNTKIFYTDGIHIEKFKRIYSSLNMRQASYIVFNEIKGSWGDENVYKPFIEDIMKKIILAKCFKVAYYFSYTSSLNRKINILLRKLGQWSNIGKYIVSFKAFIEKDEEIMALLNQLGLSNLAESMPIRIGEKI